MTDPTTPLDSSDLFSDERVRLLLDAAVDATMLLDDRAQIVWASTGTEHLLGRTLEELRKVAPLDLVHPDDVGEAARLLGRLFDGIDGDDPAVVRVSTGDDHVWVEIKATAMFDVAGIGGMVLTARDMSYRLGLEAALRDSHRRFESLVRHSNDGIVVLDANLKLTYAGPSIERLSGYPPDVLTGQDVSSVVLEPGRTELLAALDRVVADPDLVESLRVKIRHRSGERRWLEVRVSNRIDDPAIAGVIANLRDVTDVVRAETEAAQLTEIFDLTDDLVAVVDGEGKLQYMNPACARFFGLDPTAPPIGAVWKVDELLPAPGEGCLLGDHRSWNAEVVISSADGRKVPFRVQIIAHDVGDGVTRYSAVAHDVSESKRLEESLEAQALHDPLTGLPNRTLLEARLRDQHEERRSLLFIDLDHFKVINDSLGHAFGDHLLQAVADRLGSLVRTTDTVARFGGDEFVILCVDASGDGAAQRLARRIAASMEDPVVVDGSPVHVSVSIGIADEPSDGTTDPVALIRDADTAMYRAKSEGRGRTVVFDDELRRRAVERQRIESALRDAPFDGSLRLHYQPMVELATGRLTGVEALVRWHHGGRLLGPGDFISIAEETAMIGPLGAWVLDAACAELAAWHRLDGWDHLTMSVNVSVRQLQHDGFQDILRDVLTRTGIRADSLTLEITESVLLDDTAMHGSRVQRLQDLGVGLAIDDFGTGYSSLTYLARLPVDVVKLDRSFLEAAGVDDGRNRMVSGVLDLVRTLGPRCVAEGIESEEQYRLLSELGCETAQGYHIARPMPAEDLLELLTRLDAAEPWPRAGNLAGTARA